MRFVQLVNIAGFLVVLLVVSALVGHIRIQKLLFVPIVLLERLVRVVVNLV